MDSQDILLISIALITSTETKTYRIVRMVDEKGAISYALNLLSYSLPACLRPFLYSSSFCFKTSTHSPSHRSSSMPTAVTLLLGLLELNYKSSSSICMPDSAPFRPLTPFEPPTWADGTEASLSIICLETATMLSSMSSWPTLSMCFLGSTLPT